MQKDIKKLAVKLIEEDLIDLSQQVLQILEEYNNRREQHLLIFGDEELQVKEYINKVEKLITDDEIVNNDQKYEVHDYVTGLKLLFESPEFKSVELTSNQLYKIIERHFCELWSDFPTPYESHLNGGKCRRWVSEVSSILTNKHYDKSLLKYFDKPTPKHYKFKK